jgi:hypothetical protein
LFLKPPSGGFFFSLEQSWKRILVRLGRALFAGLAVLGQSLQGGAQLGVGYAVGSCLDVLGSAAG